MNKHLKDIEDRWLVYKKYNHIPSVKVAKYNFDEIEANFDNKKSANRFNTRIRISYERNFPQISNCVILNCANADAVNAGYRINHCITQEGQLFHDTDVFASNLADFYPFKFNNELLYAKDVTFHNNDDLQFDIYSLRKNDVIFAASKRLKENYETDFIKDDLKRIIDSIFKIAVIQRKEHLYLWPIGCGAFKNNPRVVAELFAKAIDKHSIHFREIVMVIFDRNGKDKSFNTFFINALNKERINYRIN